jgi:hypothetical protein
MLTKNAIHELASNKVFAKLTMLDFDIERLRDEVKHKLVGKLTIEQLTDIYEGTIKERKVWNYIAESLEKSNKN